MFIQVIDNLVKNALRSLAASKNTAGPGDLTIEVGKNATGQRGRITIADRGVGMDAHLQARIFAPFFSTDRGTGHGLGLAFCQRVVQSANGTIRVQSEPLQGAVFTIELPVLGSSMSAVRVPTTASKHHELLAVPSPRHRRLPRRRPGLP